MAENSFLSRLKTRLIGRTADASLRQSIEEVIDEHDAETVVAGDFDDTERTMLRNLLEHHDLRVDSIAVPRGDIIAFEGSGSFDELAALFAEAAHSRIPVYRESLDAIIGMIHVKDVFQHLAQPREQGPPRPEHLLRSVLFVPPSMRVLDLLARMRASRTHLAIVVDEYGGVDGLVTIEDVVEQIVGDIEDEHDESQAEQLRDLGNGAYDVDARLSLSDLEKALDADLMTDEDDEEIDTVGGMIFVLAGRVPVIGEIIEHPAGYRFEIVDGEPRRVTRVRVHAAAAKNNAAAPEALA
jgi:magnesium and cobalt transporter